MHSRLQPYALQAATRSSSRLQPCALQAATLCTLDCNAIQLLVFYPSLLISAIPVVRDNPLAKSVITCALQAATLYTPGCSPVRPGCSPVHSRLQRSALQAATLYTPDSLMILPLNQLSFSLSAIYTVAQVAAYRKAFAPETYTPPSVADFMVWTVDIPNADGSSPGPLLCLVFSIVTAPLWFYLLWLVDVRRYYHPQRATDFSGPAPADEDPDVAAERARVEGGAAGDATVRMVRLLTSVTPLLRTSPSRQDRRRLQPYAMGAAALGSARCNPTCAGSAGCNPTCACAGAPAQDLQAA